MKLLRIGALACALALAAAPTLAANHMPPVPGPQGPTQPIPAAVVPYIYTPLGCAQITSLAAAAGLTPPTGATLVVMSIEGQPVRYRDDGTNPTATVGVLLPVSTGAPWSYSGPLASIKFIQTAPTAIIDVCFYQ